MRAPGSAHGPGFEAGKFLHDELTLSSTQYSSPEAGLVNFLIFILLFSRSALMQWDNCTLTSCGITSIESLKPKTHNLPKYSTSLSFHCQLSAVARFALGCAGVQSTNQLPECPVFLS